MGRLFSPVLTFFQRTQIRQFANREIRIGLDSVRQVMTKGKVSTLVITTPPGAPPFSRANFTTVDGSEYQITWSDTPMNTVHVQRLSPAPVTDAIVATHVVAFAFTLDLNDPGILHITIQTAFPFGSVDKPENIYRTHIANQTILMHAS